MIKLKLFPFDKVNSNSSIIIYGAGEIGSSFSEQIQNINYCNLICFADKKAKSKKVNGYKVVLPDEINKFKYDYIVVASVEFKNEMYANLMDLKIDKEKIICIDDSYLILNDDTINECKNIIPENVDWNDYYDAAENGAAFQFKKFLKPKLDKYNLINSNSRVLDFACGKGRMANIFKDICKELICCDYSVEALEFCKNRFKENNNVSYCVSKEEGIQLESEGLDFIYSWDAMVHFTYKSLDIYVNEFHRLLKNGGYAFIHHSNLINSEPFDKESGIWDGKTRSDLWNENIEYRSNISKEDFAFIAKKHGFEMISQEAIDWNAKNLDCISIIKKK